MRALIPLFASFFVFASGCGDALDLGTSGSGGDHLSDCKFGPQTDPTGSGSCSSCNSLGDRCGLPNSDSPRDMECCCGSGPNGGQAVWQCFLNTQGCPSSPPELDSACNLVDATCNYCTGSGAVVYTCANNYWQNGTRSQSCF